MKIPFWESCEGDEKNSQLSRRFRRSTVPNNFRKEIKLGKIAIVSFKFALSEVVLFTCLKRLEI